MELTAIKASAAQANDATAVKEVKRAVLSHGSPCVTVASEAELQTLIALAVNLCFGNAASGPELLSWDRAREIFSEKVLSRRQRGKWCWLAFVNDMGTHHPKTQNDKVSSGGVVAHFPKCEAAACVVSSMSCSDSRRFSGAGNGANTAHYQFFALTFEWSQERRAMIECFAADVPAVRDAFLQLGVLKSDWADLVDAAAGALTGTSNGRLDRRLKQVCVPYGGDGEYVLVTPIPSSAIVASIAARNRECRTRGQWIPWHVTKVGGTKPQNAGALPNELGGVLNHFRMGFPSGERTNIPLLLRLKFISERGLLQASGERFDEVKKLLRIDWSQSTIPRENLHDALRIALDNLFRPQLLRLQKLQEEIEEARESGTNLEMIDTQLRALALWIRSAIDGRCVEPITHTAIVEEAVRSALDEIERAADFLDDTDVHLLQRLLSPLFDEILYG